MRVPSLRLSEHLTFRASSHSSDDEAVAEHLALLEQQHSTAWPDIARRPPWRIICTEFQRSRDEGAFAVSFAVHHAVADGLSSSILQSRFHGALNRRLQLGAANDEDDILNFPHDEIQLAPPVEEGASLRLSWPFFLRTLWREFGPALPFQGRPSLPWAGGVNKLEPKKTCIKLLLLSPESLKRLLRACKANKASLTSLIHALVAYILSQHLPETVVDSFVAQTSMSLRPFLSTRDNAEDLIGAYYTGMNHAISSATVHHLRSIAAAKSEKLDSEIWTIARTIKSELTARLTTLPQDDGVGLLRYVSDFRQFWEKKLGKRREVTWEVSNIGVVPQVPSADDSRCRITQAYLTQSGNVAGPAFSVNVASVEEGGLSVTLCWQETVVGEGIMEAVGVGLREGLKRLARDT